MGFVHNSTWAQRDGPVSPDWQVILRATTTGEVQRPVCAVLTKFHTRIEKIAVAVASGLEWI